MTEELRDHTLASSCTVMNQAKGRAGAGRDGAWRGGLHERCTGGKTAGAVRMLMVL